MAKKSIFLTRKKSRKKLNKFKISNNKLILNKESIDFLDINGIEAKVLKGYINKFKSSNLTLATFKEDGNYYNQSILRVKGKDTDNINLKSYEDIDILDFISKIYNQDDKIKEYQNEDVPGIYDEVDLVAPENLEEDPLYLKLDGFYQRSYTILNFTNSYEDILDFMKSKIVKFLTVDYEKVDIDFLIKGLNKYYKEEIERINKKSGSTVSAYEEISDLEEKRESIISKIKNNKDSIYTRSVNLILRGSDLENLEENEDLVKKYLLKEGAILRPLHTNHLTNTNGVATGINAIKNKSLISFDEDIDLDLKKYLKMKDFKVSYFNTGNRLTTQDSVFVDGFIDDGILHLGNGRYSKSFLIKPINFETLDEDEQEKVIIRYQEFLNSFTKEVEVFVTINNKKIYLDEFTSEILLDKNEDGMDHLRDEYNEMLINKVSEGINSIQRERYITLTLKADTYKEALEKFNVYTDLMKRSIKTIGSGEKNNSDLRILGEEERLKVLYNLLNPEKGKLLKYYNFEKMKKEGLSLSDVLAPDYIKIKSNYMIINNHYASFHFISDLPNLLNPSFFAGINEEFNEQILTTVTYNPYEQKEAVKMISNQYTNYNAELDSISKRAKRTNSLLIVPPKLEVALEETQELLADVTERDQKMFKTNVLVGVFGKTKEEMEKNSRLLKDYCDRKMVSLTLARNLQEYAMNSCLPIGQDLLPMKRSLTSEAGAVYMPFKTQNILDMSGMYYGVNPANKDLILINRKKFKNGNGFILGKPGGGKSFAAKNEILNTILTTDDDVIIVDPENEYKDICLSLGGEYIPIEQSSPYHMNLFDIEENDKEDGGLEGSIKEKVSFITGCMNLMMEQSLSIEENAILDEAITNIYKSWFKYVDEQKTVGNEVNMDYFPKLSTLREYLQNLTGREKNEAYSLITALRMYTDGSLNMFNKHSNINPKNRLVVFSIRGLANEGVLKKLAMNIIMDQIWQRLLRNGKNGRPTWIYIDEIYLLFDNANSMNFLRNLWKRARKYNGFPTGITQNVDDLLAIHDARTMLSNADFVMMLNQSSIDKQGLSRLYNIGETLQTYITDSQAGHGLIHTEFGTIPFENKFPKDTKMYEVMTTNPAEKAAIAKRKKQKAV
ncbi:VirB4-like conjugal transfer ATPase, CD1110 family [uncultured Anaerococcus sp.]|uniref:VirB4-like conjugal transfer ATPase, CD1110 family n=1 Tax=uncultured Anaerococcus sp. TaxID=293428 RepID=UPI0025F08183|nr:ATP-binding protein [uncultured Anaerococcus sp.]